MFPKQKPSGDPGKCEHCGSFCRFYTRARTCYEDDHGQWLCPSCNERHHDHWDSMWDEYRSSQGF